MRKIPIIIVISFMCLFILTACDWRQNSPAITTEVGETTPAESFTDDTKSGGTGKDRAADENIPDLSGETIVIYLIGDTAPPFTSITASVRDGADDYIAYLNANGGIFGSTVELRFADTGGSAEGVLTAYERFSNNDDNLLIILMYGGFEELLYEHVNDAHIPVLTFGLNPTLPEIDENAYIFHLTPTYPEQFVFFLNFVLNQWEKIKPDGAIDEIKVAYISWDNTYGRSALTDGVRAYAASKGIEIVWEEYLEMATTTSTTAAIFNAEIAGATVIYTNTHGFGPANLLNDLRNLAIQDFFIVGGSNWAVDVGMFELLPEVSFAEGFYSPSWYAGWTDTENQGIRFAEEIVSTSGGGDSDKTVGRLLIQGGLDIACNAIEQAILDVGYENISGEDVYRVLGEMSGYEAMEELFTVDYSNGKRAPNLLQMRQVQGDTGKLVTVKEFTGIPDFNP
jgi:branched-chain amino acid transport system substrate-binding protein